MPASNPQGSRLPQRDVRDIGPECTVEGDHGPRARAWATEPLAAGLPSSAVQPGQEILRGQIRRSILVLRELRVRQ